MKLKSPGGSQAIPIPACPCRVRWRDPLLQSWSIVAGLLILGITAHYGPHVRAGEKKNVPSLAALRLTPAETTGEWRPSVAFSLEPGLTALAPPEKEVDLRACANRAASQPAWKFLSAALREKLGLIQTTGISVTWSETPGGNAAALDHYYRHTLGQNRGTPYDFVIGNGQRGEDGLIEATRSGLDRKIRTERPVSVCLIGEKSASMPTAAQECALGELIATLEAHNGSITLAMREPSHSDLLAGAN